MTRRSNVVRGPGEWKHRRDDESLPREKQQEHKLSSTNSFTSGLIMIINTLATRGIVNTIQVPQLSRTSFFSPDYPLA
jgi:hypothetical protein